MGLGRYYQMKYGGGAHRGRGRGRGSGSNDAAPQPDSSSTNRHGAWTPTASGSGSDWQKLQHDLKTIDGSQYGAYHQLLGTYHHARPQFVLAVDKIQGDPYAAPSRVRAIMPWHVSGLPDEYLQSEMRKIATCDFVTRVAAVIIRYNHLNSNLQNGNKGWSGPKGGSFNINSPGQEILPRTSAMIDGNETIELRFTVSLPAAGRTILGQEAWQVLGVNLVQLVEQSLLYDNLSRYSLHEHVLAAERQHVLRQQLSSRGLIAFVANGSILPRASGAAAMPMASAQAIPFQSPIEAEVDLECPDGSTVRGMGIARGITLLTGGGFHGKSTLLEALELGIYNHIPGDGREGVVTDPSAVKIRAEDGRSVSGVDISPFITNLPGGKDTTSFSTDDASGSTSMAANIQEALEAGCKTLLIDEDSSATNLLVRDRRMQLLVPHEPITPLIAKARALYNEHGVSTIIVVGGLGDWLSVADRVFLLDSYVVHCITSEAEAVAQQYPGIIAEDERYGSLCKRKLRVALEGVRSPWAKRKSFISIRPRRNDPVDDPAEAEPGIDLSALDQIVEIGQARMIAALLEDVAKGTQERPLSIERLLLALDHAIGIEKGLPLDFPGGDAVAVRRFELTAALSRLRGLSVGG